MKYPATIFFALVSLAVQGSLDAQPATKNVFTTAGLTTPIGIAYSPLVNRLLLTQPFCGTVSGSSATGFQVAQLDPNGAASLFATLPDVPLSSNPLFGHNSPPFNQCFENYIAVSSGLGGFPANQVYVTQGQNVVSIPPTGGSASNFVTGLGTADTETGITFDTTGHFCNDMIITGANGAIFLVNSAGTAFHYADIPATVGLINGVAAESSSVASNTFVPYPGWLLVSIESATGGPGVAAIPPPASCGAGGVPVAPAGGTAPTRIINLPSPEAVATVPPSAANSSCQFGTGSAAGTFFAVTFPAPVVIPRTSNPFTIVSYPASNFTSIVGDAMVANEGQTVNASNQPVTTSPQTNVIAPGAGNTITSAPFDLGTSAPSFVQQEGVTFVGCPITPPSIGCVLTPGGYKNNFNYKVISLVIGGQAYTAAQVTTILSTGGGGINALGRSLATALLNIHYGAVAPQSVLDAIAAAQSAIQAVTTAVGTDIFNATLSNSIASPLNDILDAFNNGSAGQLECTR